MSRLTLAGVACVRGGRLLFEGVAIDLAGGAAAVATGPNGAGKSSLLRIAAGLLPPAAGLVSREGGVALMTEAAVLDGERTLAQALGFWATIDGSGHGAGDVAGAIAAVGLAAAADVPVRWLSTGQRRRAALARTIAARAPIWLLDEPANGLDTGGVALLQAAIAGHRAGGGIVVATTHLPLDLPGAVMVAL